MKTKITLIKISLLAGLIFSTFLVRSNNDPAKGVSTETAKTIRKYFKFPQVLLPQMESRSQATKIEVMFTTDKNGKVNYVSAKTNDRTLKQEIEKQFLGLHLENVKQEIPHSVVLSFRLL